VRINHVCNLLVGGDLSEDYDEVGFHPLTTGNVVYPCLPPIPNRNFPFSFYALAEVLTHLCLLSTTPVAISKLQRFLDEYVIERQALVLGHLLHALATSASFPLPGGLFKLCVCCYAFRYCDSLSLLLGASVADDAVKTHTQTGDHAST
jgi:hypothetical protein